VYNLRLVTRPRLTLSVVFLLFSTLFLVQCAGPGLVDPPGGLIIPVGPNSSFFSKKNVPVGVFTIVSGGQPSGSIPVFCYPSDYSEPWIAKITAFKQIFFSTPDKISCQYIAVSQLDVTYQFSLAAAARSSGVDPAGATVVSSAATPTSSNPPVQGAVPASSSVDSDKSNKATNAATAISRLRNAYAVALLNVLDYNCRAFLSSSFSTRAIADTEKDFISSLGTGTSTATTFANPYASAGIGVANLVYTSGSDSVNKNLYLDKTSDALASAIQAGMLSARNAIISKFDKGYDDYTLDQVLADAKHYEQACSIESGATQLSSIANQSLTAAGGASGSSGGGSGSSSTSSSSGSESSGTRSGHNPPGQSSSSSGADTLTNSSASGGGRISIAPSPPPGVLPVVPISSSSLGNTVLVPSNQAIGSGSSSSSSSGGSTSSSGASTLSASSSSSSGSN
jgi:hypothetical protein